MRLITALLLSALLAACTTTPNVTSNPPWPERKQRLQALAEWQAEGKIALRNGAAAESANLLWQQNQEFTELQLSGPLGMAATRIFSDGKLLTIEQDGTREVMDISTPAAIRLNTGWDLPLASLPFWMKGIPNPELAATDMTVVQELLTHLVQDGWSVDFANYREVDGYQLPTRLEVTRADTRARLIIRQWQPEARP